jgi:hypothetical protein
MIKKSNHKSRLLDALAMAVDAPLNAEGFSRRRCSLAYTRTLNGAEQEISFVTDWFPKYQPDVEAHIHPMVRLKMPSISCSALDLVQGDKMLLAGAPEIILNQPIEFAAPKDAHVRWFASGALQFVEVCQSITSFLEQWIFPLLSQLSTAEDLIRAFETCDVRLMKQKHWYVFIAAAYKVQHRETEMRRLVEEHFGSPGMRKLYSKLFESCWPTLDSK